jgi:hypothetical protein
MTTHATTVPGADAQATRAQLRNKLALADLGGALK